ncbi:NfeD family protein [Streptomyces sp. NP160]|uniref:NfeD family protein n=1 Tax=Streptomyces sp. NP160 TaxID=2586637 RepID=UPI00111A94E7|nr:NfeD family protein [Streptomyces sp. NP160]TNM68200.1 NfeD family protein [Streptomyces sp. NP160]
MAALWWVIGAFVLAGLEVFALNLVFGTLVVGALAGALAALLGGDFTVQAITASVVSLIGLAVVRPVLVKRFKVEGRFTATGTAANVGRPARVLAEVTEVGGRVKLAGEEWSARTAEPAARFPVGATVHVVAIDGATAVVAAPAGSPAAQAPPADPPADPAAGTPPSAPRQPEG